MRWADYIGKESLQAICAADLATAGAPGVCPLAHLGLLKISGEDAATFLHNQASNDVRTLDENEARLAALCNPKGRMYCSFFVFHKDGAYYLQMPRERIEPVMRRLSVFVMRAKVVLEDAGDQLCAFGVLGETADTWNVHLPAAFPVSFSTADARRRCAIYAPGETLIQLWRSATKSGYRPMQHNAWHCRDVQSGIPHVYNATSEQFIPQMVNMDLLGGVSFNKGCYPGQEIVARTHYLGKLKRRMYAFTSAVGDLAAGDEVFSEKQTEPCGRIVDFCPLPDGVSPGLTVLKIAAVSDALHARSPDGPPLTISARQPYEISRHGHEPERKP